MRYYSTFIINTLSKMRELVCVPLAESTGSRNEERLFFSTGILRLQGCFRFLTITSNPIAANTVDMLAKVI